MKIRWTMTIRRNLGQRLPAVCGLAVAVVVVLTLSGCVSPMHRAESTTPEKVTYYITSDPPQAYVTVDGVPLSVVLKTPCTLTLGRGLNHKIRIRHEGYFDSVVFASSAQPGAKFDPPKHLVYDHDYDNPNPSWAPIHAVLKRNPSAPLARVSFKLSSEPSGATVNLLEHKITTVTPCMITLPNPGTHTIRISKTGYQDSVVRKSSSSTGSVPDTPVHVVLQPQFIPSLVEGKNPLQVKRWKYDQKTQTAEFEFTVVSEGVDALVLRPWALEEIRKVCNDEYAQANHGLGKDMLGFTLITEFEMPKFMVYATVHRVQPMSHSYDTATRIGVLKVNIGKQGDANYAGAYKWAKSNIDVICSTKGTAMEAGQPPPPGAQYIILSEKTDADGMLEIKFQVIQ